MVMLRFSGLKIVNLFHQKVSLYADISEIFGSFWDSGHLWIVFVGLAKV